MDSPMVRFNMARLVWILAASVIPARAGPTIWDGSFNLYETCEDFDKCKSPFQYVSLISLVNNTDLCKKGLGQI